MKTILIEINTFDDVLVGDRLHDKNRPTPYPVIVTAIGRDTFLGVYDPEDFELQFKKDGAWFREVW